LQDDLRLPLDVLPISYDLLLHPDLKEGTFKGQVKILINVTYDVQEITLHTKDLDIEDIELVNGRVPIAIAVLKYF
jgi:hypothetical protein